MRRYASPWCLSLLPLLSIAGMLPNLVSNFAMYQVRGLLYGAHLGALLELAGVLAPRGLQELEDDVLLPQVHHVGVDLGVPQGWR